MKILIDVRQRKFLEYISTVHYQSLDIRCKYIITRVLEIGYYNTAVYKRYLRALHFDYVTRYIEYNKNKQ